MRVAAVSAAWFASLAMAAGSVGAVDAPVAVPPAYMDAPAPAAQARNGAPAVVRVAADAVQLRAARPRASARAAVPEPSGWTSLLCGLLAAGFIARRKTRWPQR